MQEFIEGYTFYHYLKHGSIPRLDNVSSQIHATPQVCHRSSITPFSILSLHFALQVQATFQQRSSKIHSLTPQIADDVSNKLGEILICS